jgi:hypothetical protein
MAAAATAAQMQHGIGLEVRCRLSLVGEGTRHSCSATSAPVEPDPALPITGVQSSHSAAMPLLAACRALDGSAGSIIGTMLPDTAGTLSAASVAGASV